MQPSRSFGELWVLELKFNKPQEVGIVNGNK